MIANFAPLLEALPIAHIRLTVRIRYLVISLILVMLLVAEWGFAIRLNFTALITLVVLYSLWNGLLYWRAQKAWAGSQTELFGHLLIDCVALTLVMYYSDGVNNPFGTLYLAAVVMAAATLNGLYTAVILLVAASAYLLLHFWYVPLTTPENAGTLYNLHLLGMWVSFVVVGLMLAVLVSMYSARVRQLNEQRLAAQQKRDMHDMTLSLGMQAAHVAHEISTPLNTSTLLLQELAEEPTLSNDAKQALSQAQNQLNQCLQRLEDLRDRLEQQPSVPTVIEVQDFMQDLMEGWQNWRPNIQWNITVDESVAERCIADDPLLLSALQALLDNAAKASLANNCQQVDVKVTPELGGIVLAIEDYGQGLDQANLERLGKVVLPRKAQGWGVGLVLSYTAVEQAGGSVTLTNKLNGGVVCRVFLPSKGNTA